MNSLFRLRGSLSKSQSIILGIVGFLIFIAFWWLLAELLSVQRPIIDGYTTRLPSTLGQDSVKINIDSLLREDSIKFANATEFTKVYPILPTPPQVVSTYPELISQDKIFSNAAQSIWLNVKGYFWAVVLSVGLGLLIGLVPLLRGLFSKQINALRYLPLTALTGLFILWFGIEDQMKVAFLAFGILVYLLPVVMQRVFEVENVYLQTTFTLGATDWQTIKSVYLPSVMSKLIDDIRVLTAISWTYIIIVEYLNRTGGLGSLIYLKQRMSRIPEMFAILFLIILIGFLQDQIFSYIDKRLFPHKYLKSSLPGVKETNLGIYVVLGAVGLMIILTGTFGLAIPVIVGWIVVITGLVFIFMGEVKLQAALRKA